jgi:hypothetical protein
MQVAVAEQREAVHEQRGDRRQRERLVEDAQVRASAAQQLRAHHESERDRQAREDQRRETGGAAGNPEQVGTGVRVHPDRLAAARQNPVGTG